jgi:hypothetical protein
MKYQIGSVALLKFQEQHIKAENSNLIDAVGGVVLDPRLDVVANLVVAVIVANDQSRRLVPVEFPSESTKGIHQDIEVRLGFLEIIRRLDGCLTHLRSIPLCLVGVLRQKGEIVLDFSGFCHQFRHVTIVFGVLIKRPVRLEVLEQ